MLFAPYRFSCAHHLLVVYAYLDLVVVSYTCMILQGPLGWQTVSGLPIGEGLLHRDAEFFINADEDTEFSAISLEATIQKHIQEELYNSALEVSVCFSRVNNY